MKQRVTAICAASGSDGSIAMGGRPMHLWVPSADQPPANCIEHFSQETYTLAEWMWHIQSDVHEHRFFFPSHFAAVMAFIWRLHPPLEKFPTFISQLRRLHPTMPRFGGKQILSYHEFAISNGYRWRNWPYDERFLCVADVKAAPAPRDHPDHFEYLAKLVAERFAASKRKWPFKPIPFPTLLDCIEFEADRVAPTTPNEKGTDIDADRLDQILLKFSSPGQRAMLKELWGKGSASFKRLAEIRGKNKQVTADAERKAIDRLIEKIDEMPESKVSIFREGGGLRLKK